jgi:hypothetical protein
MTTHPRRTLASTSLTVVRRSALAASVVAAASLASSSADAQERFERVVPSEDFVARYPIEIEGHFSFGAGDVYGNTGFGGGVRLSIPLVAGWLGRDVADNLAISFGGDILNYDNCYYSNLCGANYLMFPVAAQWNVFFGRHVSVFGEGGAYLYKGFFDGCGPGNAGCGAPSDFGILPTFAVGFRYRIVRNVALLARVGYPMSTLGVSWL